MIITHLHLKHLILIVDELKNGGETGMNKKLTSISIFFMLFVGLQIASTVTAAENVSNPIISKAKAKTLSEKYMRSSNRFDSLAYVSKVTLQNRNTYHAVILSGDYGFYEGYILINTHTGTLIKIYVIPHD